LVDASVLIATSVVFFFVPNLCLLLPIHWSLATACQRLVVLEQWSTTGRPSEDLIFQARK
jgi:hypothetical protein